MRSAFQKHRVLCGNAASGRTPGSARLSQDSGPHRLKTLLLSTALRRLPTTRQAWQPLPPHVAHRRRTQGFARQSPGPTSQGLAASGGRASNYQLEFRFRKRVCLSRSNKSIRHLVKGTSAFRKSLLSHECQRTTFQKSNRQELRSPTACLKRRRICLPSLS